MSIESYSEQIIEFVRQNEVWAPPIVFALAFGESLAFISMLVPAWAALIAIGGLVGASKMQFWPIWVAASMGAGLGDWVSYWIGLKLGKAIYHRWPFSRHPHLISKGEAFVKKWGVSGVFIGRFFGPLRAVVPLVAGVFAMPYRPFQVANFASAFLWAAVVLQIGKFGSEALIWLWE